MDEKLKLLLHNLIFLPTTRNFNKLLLYGAQFIDQLDETDGFSDMLSSLISKFSEFKERAKNFCDIVAKIENKVTDLTNGLMLCPKTIKVVGLLIKILLDIISY